jgi:RNA polymerase sigma-70 factor (ECF subfamily)
MWVVAEKIPDPSPNRIDPSVKDEELIHATLAGDLSAFSELVRRYEHRLYNFVLRFAGNHHDAEEIVQETFFKAYSHLREFRGDARFATWIYQIAKNLCINHYYQGLRNQEGKTYSVDEVVDGDGEEGERYFRELVSPDPTPEAELLSREVLNFFERALSELEPHFRMALILRDVEGRDYEEIAEILGVPIGTVKSRIHRARLMIQKRLEPFFHGGKTHG